MYDNKQFDAQEYQASPIKEFILRKIESDSYKCFDDFEGVAFSEIAKDPKIDIPLGKIDTKNATKNITTGILGKYSNHGPVGDYLARPKHVGDGRLGVIKMLGKPRSEENLEVDK